MKILLLGDSGVGKTALCMNILHNIHITSYIPTAVVDIHRIGNNTIWELCGDPRYDRLRESYYVGADRAIIMCSEKWSISHTHRWIHSVRKTCGDIPISLIFNNIDSNIICPKNMMSISCNDDPQYLMRRLSLQ